MKKNVMKTRILSSQGFGNYLREACIQGVKIWYWYDIFVHLALGFLRVYYCHSSKIAVSNHPDVLSTPKLLHRPVANSSPCLTPKSEPLPSRLDERPKDPKVVFKYEVWYSDALESV